MRVGYDVRARKCVCLWIYVYTYSTCIGQGVKASHTILYVHKVQPYAQRSPHKHKHNAHAEAHARTHTHTFIDTCLLSSGYRCFRYPKDVFRLRITQQQPFRRMTTMMKLARRSEMLLQLFSSPPLPSPLPSLNNIKTLS